MKTNRPPPPIKPAKPGPVTVLFAALFLVGCSQTPRDIAVASINASADLGGDAEKVLAELDRAEQTVCLENGDAAPTCLVQVRQRYHAAWSAYRTFRLAWLASAAGARAYDTAKALGQAPSPTDLMKLAVDLSDAATKFEQALATVKGGIK